MHPKHYAYPAFFHYEAEGISIEFPDLPGCLPCAKTTEEAFHHAKEALGLHLYGMERDGDAIPLPSPVSALSPEAGAVMVMVEVFMPAVRDRMDSKVVKKTLTIPAWLNREAEAANVNFSQLLQDSLRQYLGEPPRA